MSPKIQDYDVLDVIGSGSFGTCFKVRHKSSKDLFVWKAIDYGKLSNESKQNLVTEVNLLSKLNHPNIVKYYDRILHKETTTLYIIMEWCQGGDLAKLVKSAKTSGQILKEDFIWRVLYQISRAVQVCHTTLCKFTVLHRDIKPANVFLDDRGNAKLGDFGLARVVEPNDDCSPPLVGTPYYMSPEVIRGHRHNRKSDIWALGCLVYELCSLKPPFGGIDMNDLHNNIKTGKYAPIPEHYSDNLVKVISFMLSVKHEYRPTVEMILHHPLVVQNISDFPRPLKPAAKENALENICVNALKNMSMATEAEDVTQNLFRAKWLSRLEALRAREAKLKEREQMMASRERMLMNKERHLVLKEKETVDRIALAEVTMNRKRNEKVASILNNSRDTEFSADPGDTSVLPTSSKIDPQTLHKINFSRSKSERRKRVTFTCEKRKALQLISAHNDTKTKTSINLTPVERRPLETMSSNPIKKQGWRRSCQSENNIWSAKGSSAKTDQENVRPRSADGVVISHNSQLAPPFKVFHTFL